MFTSSSAGQSSRGFFLLAGITAWAFTSPTGVFAADEASAAATEKKEEKRTEAVTDDHIVPLLHLRCTACHGLRRQEAELDLRSKASILKGGKSGPAMVLGNPAESLIIKRLRAEEMPPRKQMKSVSVRPMQAPEIELLERWIAQGAPESTVPPDVATTEPDPLVSDEDRQFWSFQPPREPAIAVCRGSDRVRNPIDAFILRKLEEKGGTLSPEASRRTLIRRVYQDLTGLPPEPETVEAFLADSDPRAYEKLIDRLLDSPRYGERWGRFWLDLAGYADSEGVQNSDRVRPQAYRYRDYVIRAFNADKPYDQFLREQIAGDEMADYENAEVITQDIYDKLVATGFLRLTPNGSYFDITNFVTDRLEIISDQIEVLTSTTMGLTMKCVRCHTHKSDPIPHRDFYRLAAVFKGATDEHDWLKPEYRYLPYVTTAEFKAWEAKEKELSTTITKLNGDLAEVEKPLAQKHTEERLLKLPEALHDDLRKLLVTPAEKRDEAQKYLAAKFEKSLRISREELRKLDAGFNARATATGNKIKAFEGKRTKRPQIRASWDRGSPSRTYILERGNYLRPGRRVGPGVPSVLTDGKTPFVPVSSADGKKTGRRLAFARWVTRPEHPLTARVMVNRVWKHHFENGIVRTTENFGKTGAPPTHPELLDWLAVEFVRNGWSVKKLHRLIMTSSMYRQSSRVSPEAEEIDPDNDLLSRMPLRRLEAEALRDSLLCVAGRLDRTPFGPADGLNSRADGLVTSMSTAKGWRRSIYVLQRRSQSLTILENFDLPTMNPNCTDRTESTVAPQALHLLNNKMIHDLSMFMAERVLSEAGTEPARQVERVYQLAFSRPPTNEEKSLAVALLSDLSTKWRLERPADSNAAATPTVTLVRRGSKDQLSPDCDQGNLSRCEGSQFFGTAEAHNQPIGSINDGVYGDSSSYITGAPGPTTGLNYLGISFAEETVISDIAIGRDNTGQLNDRAEGPYEVQIARDDIHAAVGDGTDPARVDVAVGGVKWITVAVLRDHIGAEAWRRHHYRLDEAVKARAVRVLSRAENGFDELELGNPLPPREARPPPLTVEGLALANFCHAVMNSAEFLYVD